MLFNSFSFACFLPIVFIIYWVLPHKSRWFLLLLSSYYFYMSWNVKYIVLILFTTALSYSVSILIERYPKNKKILLIITLLILLGILFLFKYFDFAFMSLSVILKKFSITVHPITLKLILPVGISFYTFQTLSYVIDVYRGTTRAERHFGKYAAFISFFPQLVAGPIERTGHLLPQIKMRHYFNYENASYGIKLIAWGFFKKVVIADTLAVYVDSVYNDIVSYQGFALVIATVFFSFQIYCDFSGYSDIAIGVARLFDINLTTNFRSPYFSTSIKEFWSKWHISLSTWFRDYIYIPLGGNRVNLCRRTANLLVTFLASGLWHGANWTYVVWGGMHGFAQAFENILKNKIPKGLKCARFLKGILVFTFCTFAWSFFRAKDLSDAVYAVSHFMDGITHPVDYILLGCQNMGIYREEIMKIAAVVLVLLVFDFIALKQDVITLVSSWPLLLRWSIYCGFLIFIFWLAPGKSAEFVYFQF